MTGVSRDTHDCVGLETTREVEVSFQQEQSSAHHKRGGVMGDSMPFLVELNSCRMARPRALPLPQLTSIRPQTLYER